MKALLITTALFTSLSLLPVTRAADEKKPKPYTLKTCPTDGEKLDSMGTPYTFIHEGREIKLCCKGCLDDFKKNSAKYIKKIEQEEQKQKK